MIVRFQPNLYTTLFSMIIGTALCPSVMLAQTTTVLPVAVAAATVVDLGAGPQSVRVVSGNPQFFTGSGTSACPSSVTSQTLIQSSPGNGFPFWTNSHICVTVSAGPTAQVVPYLLAIGSGTPSSNSLPATVAAATVVDLGPGPMTLRTLSGDPKVFTGSGSSSCPGSLTSQTYVQTSTGSELPMWTTSHVCVTVATGPTAQVLPYLLSIGSTTTPVVVPGGTSGQTQYNNAGAFGGYTPNGDVTVVPSTGAETVGKINGVPVDPSSSANGDILQYNGTSYLHTALLSAVNAACTLFPTTCAQIWGYYSPYWYGATGNGSTNDLTAFQNAMAAVPAWGTLFLPCGTYSLSGSGTQLLLRTTNINIRGAGWCAKIVVPNGSTAQDLFHISPPSGQNRGWLFENFAIDTTASSSLANIWHLDTHASNTSGMGAPKWVNMQMFGASGSFIFLFDNPLTNTNGGAFQVVIAQNELGGNGSVLSCSNCGDSFWITRNFVFAGQFGFTVTQIAGAGNFNLLSNSIISACPLLFKTGVAPVVAFNVIEQEVTNTCNDNAQLDFNGTINSTTIENPKVIGNQVQAPVAGTGNPNNVFLAGVNRAYLDGNYFSISGGGTTCVTDNSTSSNDRWGINDFLSCSTRIANGTATFKYVTTGTSDNN